MAKKLTLQDRINAIKPYFSSFEIKETLFIVKIVFPDKWQAYNRDDEVIKVAKSDGNAWYYYAETKDVESDDIFDLIEETIKTNETVYKKIELMKQKMEELKDLFQEESLERLQNLQFVLSDLKRPRRKKTKKDEQTIIKQEEAATEPLKQEIEASEEPTIINQNELDVLEEGWK